MWVLKYRRKFDDLIFSDNYLALHEGGYAYYTNEKECLKFDNKVEALQWAINQHVGLDSVEAVNLGESTLKLFVTYIRLRGDDVFAIILHDSPIDNIKLTSPVREVFDDYLKAPENYEYHMKEVTSFPYSPIVKLDHHTLVLPEQI